MGGMATGTHGRYHKTAFQQALPVNALYVTAYDFMFLTSVAHRSFLSFTVTLGTK